MSLFLEMIRAHLCKDDNKNEDILLLGEGATQGLDDNLINSISYLSYYLYTTKQRICIKSVL